MTGAVGSLSSLRPRWVVRIGAGPGRGLAAPIAASSSSRAAARRTPTSTRMSPTGLSNGRSTVLDNNRSTLGMGWGGAVRLGGGAEALKRAAASKTKNGASRASRAGVRTEASLLAAAAGSEGNGGAKAPQKSQKPVIIWTAVLALSGVVMWLMYQNTAIGKAAYAALSKSGFTAAFALIFVSELGDKTFFIAALLAMRLGRATVLAGATSALGLMSVVSVAIGRIFQQIPNALTTSVPIGEYLAVALLLFFGVRTLKEALETPEPDEEEESGELADAAEAVSKSEAESKGGSGFLAAFWETFSLVFIAEWGDRSMLATIALGAAQSPVGVAAGATVGHLIATFIAVAGGSMLSQRISERQVGIVGGVLFILFALATLAGVY